MLVFFFLNGFKNLWKNDYFGCDFSEGSMSVTQHIFIFYFSKLSCNSSCVFYNWLLNSDALIYYSSMRGLEYSFFWKSNDNEQMQDWQSW